MRKHATTAKLLGFTENDIQFLMVVEKSPPPESIPRRMRRNGLLPSK